MPDPDLSRAESIIGRWLMPTCPGIQPCRVLRVDWSERGRTPKVFTEVVKRDGGRCVLTYYVNQWKGAVKKRRLATEREAAELDEKAKGWGSPLTPDL